jgi:hypothetical protein
MLKQLRPLSLMLALAAALPAAQASVLTCDFNDIAITPPDKTLALSGKQISCGSGIADALTFGSGATLASSSTATGWDKTQYVRGTSFTISLSSAIHVNGLTLDLTLPSGGGSVIVLVSGRNVDSNNQPITDPWSPSPGSTGSTFQWIANQLLTVDPTKNLGDFETLTFTAQNGVQIDNLRFSLSDAPAVVPEPSLFGLTGLALAAAGFAGRRRQNRGA